MHTKWAFGSLVPNRYNYSSETETDFGSIVRIDLSYTKYKIFLINNYEHIVAGSVDFQKTTSVCI